MRPRSFVVRLLIASAPAACALARDGSKAEAERAAPECTRLFTRLCEAEEAGVCLLDADREPAACWSDVEEELSDAPSADPDQVAACADLLVQPECDDGPWQSAFQACIPVALSCVELVDQGWEEWADDWIDASIPDPVEVEEPPRVDGCDWPAWGLCFEFVEISGVEEWCRLIAGSYGIESVYYEERACPERVHECAIRPGGPFMDPATAYIYGRDEAEAQRFCEELSGTWVG